MDASIDYRSGKAVIGNERIKRVFRCAGREGGFFTHELTDPATGRNWSCGAGQEVRLILTAGDRSVEIDGAGLRFDGGNIRELNGGGKELILTLLPARSDWPVRIFLQETIVPGGDWLRRRLSIENMGRDPVTVMRYDPEILAIPKNMKGYYVNSWRWGARQLVKDLTGCAGVGLRSFYVGGRSVQPATVPTDSPLVLTENDGFMWYFPEIPVGHVMVREDPDPWLGTCNPWGQTIEPGETAEFGAGVVVGLGKGDHRVGFRSFRSYLETQVLGEKRDGRRATLVYNTWYGLGMSETEPCEASCLKQINEAAELGLEMFVLDAGWFTIFGDWEVAVAKFPNGLRSMVDACHEKGLKFGIWIDSRIAHTKSKVYQAHPDWAVRGRSGNRYQCGGPGDEMAALCMASGFGDQLKDTLVNLTRELQLDCLKIDNVCNLSYYDFWTQCHAKDHHHVPGASHRMVWEKWIEILNAVRAVRPELIIESIPSGLSLLNKHDLVWTADYQFRPDWMREAYFCRALNYHMAYSHPAVVIHQPWPSPECTDLQVLDYFCASTLGSNIQCGLTGRLEDANEAQKAILKKWINWSKENRRYLTVYQPLFEDKPPVPLEMLTDDDLMRTLGDHWRPPYVDGFAHLLSDGGWIFLFNPTDAIKSISFTMKLSDYGINDFSALTDMDGSEYLSEQNTLILNRVLPAGGYAQARLHTGWPIHFIKSDGRFLDIRWNDPARRLSLTPAGEEGMRRITLTTSGWGRPALCENALISRYDPNTDTLEITYEIPTRMSSGSPLPIQLIWSA